MVREVDILLNIKVIKHAKSNSQPSERKEFPDNQLPNRAFDPDLAPYETAAYVLWTGFSFVGALAENERFETVCEVLRNAGFATLDTVSFQRGTEYEFCSFNGEEITQSLNEKMMKTMCQSDKIDRAYFFYSTNGRPFLVIVEKSRCDVAVFYDMRLFTRSAILELKNIIEDEYYSKQRNKIGLVLQ